MKKTVDHSDLCWVAMTKPNVRRISAKKALGILQQLKDSHMSSEPLGWAAPVWTSDDHGPYEYFMSLSKLEKDLQRLKTQDPKGKTRWAITDTGGWSSPVVEMGLAQDKNTKRWGITVVYDSMLGGYPE